MATATAPDLHRLGYPDAARYGADLAIETDGTARLTDAFGNYTYDRTPVWLLIVRTDAGTTIGACFGDDEASALDSALWLHRRAGTPATADLIRPLGMLEAVDDLLVEALDAR